MSTTRLLVCLCLFLAIAPAAATIAADDPAAPSEFGSLIADAGDSGDHDGADAVIVFDRTEVDMEPSGLSHVVRHALTKVLTDAGARRLAFQRFDYDPATQLIEIRRVAVHRAAGGVEEVDLSALVDVSAPAYLIYWGARMLGLGLPRLEIGDAVEIETYRKGYQIAYLGEAPAEDESKYIPPMAGHYYEVVLFRGDDPIVEKTYTLRTPRDKPVQYSVYNGEIYSEQTFDDDAFTYRFWKRDVPAAPHEWRRIDATDFAPKVVLATVQDWREKSRWFFETNDWVFADNAAIRAKVAELVDGLDNDDERIAVINQWVANNIRYCGLNMGEGEGYTIHPGEMIFRERSGVCKDIAGMTITMLRSAGYEVYPAMTMAGARVERIPADQFNHCVAALRREDGSFEMIDPTWVPLSRYNWSRAEGGQHFVIGTPEGEDLSMTAPYAPDENLARLGLEARISAEGDLTGTLTLAGEGYIDTRLRHAAGGGRVDAAGPGLQRWLETLSPGAELTGFAFGEPYDFARACTLELEFRIAGYARMGDRAASWRPLAPQLMKANFAGIFRFAVDAPPAERETPAMVWFPERVVVSERVELPRGFTVKAPESAWRTGESGDLAWCDLAATADGRSLKLEGDLILRERVLPPDEWPAFHALVETVDTLAENRFLAWRKGE